MRNYPLEAGIMAEIKPFKGVLYDREKVGGDYSLVMAPPYDVISEGMRDELCERNKYNIVRLILGKSFEGDNDRNNKYVRAKDFLNKWFEDGVVKRDRTESFYGYLQEYYLGGKKYERTGFMGLMKIESSDKDVVLPHEYTHTGPKEDRLNLIKEVKSNLSPLFTLYEDAKGAIRSILDKGSFASGAVMDITIDGVRHKLWRISDREDVGKIISQMKDKKIFIADGHHRYEVAKSYSKLCKENPGYSGNADHVMMFFTDIKDSNNLTIMATHRVIKKIQDIESVLSKLEVYFETAEYGGLSELVLQLEARSGEIGVFGFLIKGKYLLLRPKDDGRLLGLIREKKSAEWKKLDVSILHSAVLKNILFLDDAEGNITYVRDPVEAESLVKNGSHTAAFLLNPTKVEQLKAVAELGEMMPQKSTYFYPKLLSGLVIHKFEDGKNGSCKP